MRAAPGLLAAILLSAALSGCYGLRESAGGGQAEFAPPRLVEPADIALPEGYRIEAVAEGLTFPTGVTFDDQGAVYVTESGYSYGEVFLPPRLVQVRQDGGLVPLAVGDDGSGPWTGVAWHDGAFYVADGGVGRGGGRMLRIQPGGGVEVLLDGLPSFGDHHLNGPAVGADGWLYFATGTATNSGIVGPDNAAFGWLTRHPDFHDVPCQDVRLSGANVLTPNALAGWRGPDALTGPYLPFGTPGTRDEVVAGAPLCHGAVFRMPPEGGSPELVAWGFRNPFGIAFAPGGGLYVTDHGYDLRGSRPVFGAGDLLWAVSPGLWHGWPDFHGTTPLDVGERYVPPGGPPPRRLLAEHPNLPPTPAAILAVHSASSGLDFAREAAFGHVGQAFVAQFGDLAPVSGHVWAPVGFRIVRVDIDSGVVTPFAANRGEPSGPASRQGGGGLERPVAVRFDPSGDALYVVDFGVMTIAERTPQPQPGTGVLWRILRGTGAAAGGGG